MSIVLGTDRCTGVPGANNCC